jgi:hypothetical protein
MGFVQTYKEKELGFIHSQYLSKEFVDAYSKVERRIGRRILVQQFILTGFARMSFWRFEVCEHFLLKICS